MIKNKKRKNKLIIKVVLLFIVVCLFTIGIFQLLRYTSFRKAIVLATTKEPSTFTELYFEDHLSLPNKVALFKENNFKFTIHNLEKKDMEYPYEVYINTNGEKQLICRDTVSIKDNEYETIAVNFTISIPIQRSKVIINLIDKNEQIYFWIEEE